MHLEARDALSERYVDLFFLAGFLVIAVEGQKRGANGRVHVPCFAFDTHTESELEWRRRIGDVAFGWGDGLDICIVKGFEQGCVSCVDLSGCGVVEVGAVGGCGL